MAKPRFEKRILGKYDVGYFVCTQCASLQTEAPYWLEEVYQDDHRALDTWAAIRTRRLQVLTYFIARAFNVQPSEQILDWGAGDGLYVRMLRDMGFDAYHCDLYCKNVYANGFDGSPASTYAAVTAFEVLEHFANPKQDLDELFSLNPQLLIATTGIYNGQGPEWNYLMPMTGAHVFFYSDKAIQHIAKEHHYQVEIVADKYIIFYKHRPSKKWLCVLRLILKHADARFVQVLFALQKHACRADHDHQALCDRVRRTYDANPDSARGTE
jgi:hypothetical protein